MPAQSPAVFLVDDNTSSLSVLHSLVTDMIGPRPIVVYAFRDPRDALAQLPRFQVRLALIDTKMLSIDGGMQLIQQIRHASPATRTVLIAADPTPDLKLQALHAGVAYLLPKPFPLVQLEEIIEASLS